MGWLVAIVLCAGFFWNGYVEDRQCQQVDVVKIVNVPMFKICKNYSETK